GIPVAGPGGPAVDVDGLGRVLGVVTLDTVGAVGGGADRFQGLDGGRGGVGRRRGRFGRGLGRGRFGVLGGGGTVERGLGGVFRGWAHVLAEVVGLHAEDGQDDQAQRGAQDHPPAVPAPVAYGPAGTGPGRAARG